MQLVDKQSVNLVAIVSRSQSTLQNEPPGPNVPQGNQRKKTFKQPCVELCWPAVGATSLIRGHHLEHSSLVNKL